MSRYKTLIGAVRKRPPGNYWYCEVTTPDQGYYGGACLHFNVKVMDCAACPLDRADILDAFEEMLHESIKYCY